MNSSLNRQFIGTVFPSMLAFMFSGIYAIVDGFFVGQNVGDSGLAAINMAYPMVAFIQAAGTGIGMGGAVKVSLAIGKRNETEQNCCFSATVCMLAVASALVMAVLLVLQNPLLKLFGARGDVLVYAESYIRVIVFGSVFQVFGVGLIPLIRNYDGSVAAMSSMMAGFGANVLLDWLFVSVWQQGVWGAAVATVIGQLVTVLCCVLFFLRKSLWRYFSLKGLQWREVMSILLIGISPFGLTMSPNLVIVILNKGASVFGGTEAVACYAVISYMICVVQLLLQGIGDGSQPLLGRYYGAGDRAQVHQVRRLSYLWAIATAVISMAVLFFLRRMIPVGFGASAGTVEDTVATLPIFLCGLVFVAFLRVTMSYFYVMGANRYAYILIYGEPVLLAVLVSVLMPRILGIGGVWWSVPVTQAVLCILAVFFLNKISKDHSVS